MGKYKRPCIVITLWLFFLFLCLIPQVQAQWAEQTIVLNPGWNAIYLEVEPRPNQCDAVFLNLPIESVWMWNSRESAVEYIQNPDTLVPQNPQWMVYFPPSHPDYFLTNLFILLGGKGYLIKSRGKEPVTWTVTGRPCLPKITWRPDSFNLVGFPLAQGQEPFFGTFFSPSLAHKNQEIYRLKNEIWEKVSLPAATRMRQGEAFWVYCKGHSDYTGPLVCQVEQGDGLDYGRTLIEQPLRIRTLASTQTSISLDLIPSENPADESQPPVAGDVPLSYWRFEPQINEAGWTSLPKPFPLNIASGEEKMLRLSVSRSSMPAMGVCQSVLEVKGAGMRLIIPVSASGSGGSAETALRAKTSLQSLTTVRHAGLWVGSAMIKGVSQPADPVAPDDPNKSTASEFQFRLILHVDAQGTVRLLREVIQMWADGTWKTDPDDPTKKIVDQPGRFVLLTDDALLSQYNGAAIRTGKPVGRRISSAAFSFDNPLVMQGSFADTGTLTCAITVDPDDPLNPFKHKYHPDHDNLNESRTEFLEETFGFTRTIELEFTDHDPMVSSEEAQSPGWNDTDMGGIYKETIEGVHKNKIHTKGFFYLHRVSPVEYLNDGRS